MSNVGNKYKVGVFVVIAVSLLVMSLTMLGVMNIFRPKYMFMTVLDSSVQGLEVGAKVKIKGVTIGKVTQIQIGLNGAVVYVYMEFIANSLNSSLTKNLRASHDKYEYFKKFINERVKKGLRCQLHYNGITGTLYQELRIIENAPPPPDFALPPGHPPYIPSVAPVLMGDILKNLNRTLANTAKIDLAPMIKKLETLADSGNRILDNRELQQIIHDLAEVMKNLDSITGLLRHNIDKEGFMKFIHNSNVAVVELNRTLVKTREFIAVMNREIEAARLQATAASARNFMDNGSATMKELREALRGNLENLTRTINNANATLQAARDLLNTLEQNPGSVIYGAEEHPVVEH